MYHSSQSRAFYLLSIICNCLSGKQTCISTLFRAQTILIESNRGCCRYFCIQSGKITFSSLRGPSNYRCKAHLASRTPWLPWLWATAILQSLAPPRFSRWWRCPPTCTCCSRPTQRSPIRAVRKEGKLFQLQVSSNELNLAAATVAQLVKRASWTFKKVQLYCLTHCVALRGLSS